jgi:hypothetical protein
VRLLELLSHEVTAAQYNFEVIKGWGSTMSLDGLLVQKEWTREIQSIERMPGEQSEFRRSAVIALGESLSIENRAQLLQVIATDPMENNRESAIKALQYYGGELVVNVLESIAHGAELSRYGQQAAVKALEALGLAPKNELVFDPRRMDEIFKGSIITSTSDQRPLRGTTSAPMILNFGMFSEELIGFPIDRVQRLRLDLAIEFDLERAAVRCQRVGLSIKKVGDNAIEVSGEHFPGFAFQRPQLNLLFFKDESMVRVFSGPIPTEAECKDYQATARLIARLTTWAGGPRSGEEKELRPSAVPPVMEDGDGDEGLMDFAARLQNTKKPNS